MLFQIVANYKQPKTLVDNQKLQAGCLLDNYSIFS